MRFFLFFKRNPLLIVFLLALIIRLYKLEVFPLGFHADEVRVGWNAYSILKTGKDDYSQLLTLYYNTFGDFRPSGIFYLTSPSIAFFGLNQFAVRFPSALLGSAIIFPLYLIVKEFIRFDAKLGHNVGLLSAFFLAIQPWEIAVSRATSEAVVSSFFLMFGLYYLLKTNTMPNKKNYFLAFLFFLFGYLFYHSGRLIVPLFAIIFIFYTPISSLKKAILFAGATIMLTVMFALLPGTLERFKQVALTKDHDFQQTLGTHKRAEWDVVYSSFRNQYATYLSADFLIGDASKPLRYRIYGFGLISVGLFTLAIAGIMYSFRKKGIHLPVWLFFISPIPAAITAEDSPNLHRTIFMSLLVCYFGALGFLMLWQSSIKTRLFGLFCALVTVGSFITYMYSYFGIAKFDAAPYRNFGAHELISFIDSKRESVDEVYLTNEPDSPYAWYAFYTKADPNVFNSVAKTRSVNPTWKYQNITFTSDRCPAALTLSEARRKNQRILVVDSGICDKESIQIANPKARLEKEITYPDSTVVYRIWSEGS